MYTNYTIDLTLLFIRKAYSSVKKLLGLLSVIEALYIVL